MCILVLRNRVRLLSRAAGLAILAGAAAGCSSDFTRFDPGLYADASAQPAGQAANPYPGDVDATTTASVGGNAQLPAPHPLADVSERPVVPDHAGYQPSGSSYSPQYPAQNYAARQPAGPADVDRVNPGTYRPGSVGSSGSNGQAVSRTELPRLAPPSSSRQTDSVTTASVAPKTAPAGQGTAAAGNERGWTGTGGTTVTLRSGETIYNLSKRYGVPVKELMRVNAIADPSQVQAGQRIVIPTYVYASSAPVSAPDSNPATRYASSSRGSLYAPSAASVPVPQPKPSKLAALGGGLGGQAVHPAPQTDGETPAPAVKADAVNRYKVTSGDTLSRIAARNGVGVAEIKAANNLSSDAIRIGQELLIPSASTQVAAASAPAGVDPIVTGTNRAEPPKPYTKPDAGEEPQQTASVNASAPARTGIEEFRWPVRGRVIANFGDKTASGRNDGIDISVPEGTAVKAVENGVVVYSGSELEGFGNLVLVRHQGGWVSAYAHNKALEVKRGDEVRRGETIARSGRTGNADMPKLHFELRRNSTPVDPLKHLGGA